VRWVVALGLILLAACSKQPPPLPWTVLDKNQQQAWLQLALEHSHCPSNQLPEEAGLWVDNGMGYWHDIGGLCKAVPFYNPSFRVAWVAMQNPWPTEAKIYGCREDLRVVKRAIGSLVEDTRAVPGTAVYDVIVNERSQSGLYQLGTGSTANSYLVYADPAFSILAKRGYRSSYFAVWDATANVEVVRTEIVDWPTPEAVSFATVDGNQAMVELCLGSSFPVYSHWATVAYASPDVHYFPPGFENSEGILISRFPAVAGGKVLPDYRRSTNFDVYYRCWVRKTVIGHVDCRFVVADLCKVGVKFKVSDVIQETGRK